MKLGFKNVTSSYTANLKPCIFHRSWRFMMFRVCEVWGTSIVQLNKKTWAVIQRFVLSNFVQAWKSYIQVFHVFSLFNQQIECLFLWSEFPLVNVANPTIIAPSALYLKCLGYISWRTEHVLKVNFKWRYYNGCFF